MEGVTSGPGVPKAIAVPSQSAPSTVISYSHSHNLPESPPDSVSEPPYSPEGSGGHSPHQKHQVGAGSGALELLLHPPGETCVCIVKNFYKLFIDINIRCILFNKGPDYFLRQFVPSNLSSVQLPGFMSCQSWRHVARSLGLKFCNNFFFFQYRRVVCVVTSLIL